MNALLRSDLPLDRHAARIFLPASIAFMVFLATLALAGGIGLDNLFAQWRSAIDAAFTVELPQTLGESESAAKSRRARVVDALTARPGIAGVTLMSDAEKARLLAPWLGADVQALDLPLPDIIAVVLKPGAALDLRAVAGELATLSPGAAIDDHGRWRGAIAAIDRTARRAVLGLLVLIGAVAALTVIFVAQAGLAAHRSVIEVLHLIGAHDGYIAGQFQRHALARGLLGGIAGALAAAAVFEAGRRLFPELATAGFALEARQWAGLALLPVAAALLAMVTARYTVLASLRKMM
jgi:cell division transport system permease protein